MNTIQKMVALAALCLMVSPTINAQDKNQPKPIQSAAELQQKWFEVDTYAMRYQIVVELDKGESMILKFKKLSDWTSGTDFMNAFTAADKVMNVYKDSLQQAQNTKVLDVYIPPNQKNLISRFSQYNESGNMMTINEDGASGLKLGMDTLRIVQSKAGNARLQYTFILKELSNYNAYQRDDEWKMKTANILDSVVNEYRKKWKKPDANKHGLNITINPSQNTKSVSQSWRLSNNSLNIEAGFGASLVRNTLCPNVDYGIGVYVGKGRTDKTFVRLSTTAFYRYTETATNRFKGYSTAFVNLELGSESNHVNARSLFYKTSLGFGYKLINKKEEDRDPTMDKQMYRVFFNYSITKFLVLTPEVVTNFRKGDRKNSWLGLSLNLRLL